MEEPKTPLSEIVRIVNEGYAEAEAELARLRSNLRALEAQMREVDWSEHTLHPASVETLINAWADWIASLLKPARRQEP